MASSVCRVSATVQCLSICHNPKLPVLMLLHFPIFTYKQAHLPVVGKRQTKRVRVCVCVGGGGGGGWKINNSWVALEESPDFLFKFIDFVNTLFLSIENNQVEKLTQN